MDPENPERRLLSVRVRDRSTLLMRPLDELHLRSPHPCPLPWGTAIESNSAAGPHWQALNLDPNRNLARLRFLEIKSKITIKIGKKPFRLNSMAVLPGPLPQERENGSPLSAEI